MPRGHRAPAGEVVDGPRALSASRSYATLASLGRPPGAPPPALPPPPPSSRKAPPPFGSPGGGWGTARGDESGGEEDASAPSSVYLDADAEEDERASFIAGSGPGSAGSAGSEPWGGDRERAYSARLLLEQPSSFKAMQASEEARGGWGGGPPPTPPRPSSFAGAALGDGRPLITSSPGVVRGREGCDASAVRALPVAHTPPPFAGC